MIDGFIKKYNLMCIKQTQMLVGILIGISESCQFTKYKKGQYYDWHCDSWDQPYQRQQGDPSHGKIRKLSVTVTLSDPKDYKGGELEFDFRNLIQIKNLTLKNVQKYYLKDL
jgi:predicted 2-oxoglutarate/Fe(II)-dependent dioxygenase YbiX